jgi:hypothetical protein
MAKFYRLLSLVLAFLTFNANATDTYNHLNNQLSIPAVILGDTVYRDVVITVGEVLTVGGTSSDPKYSAKPSSSPDTYNPTTNRLTIPNVNAFGLIYHDVVITVDKVLSVNDSVPIGKLSSLWSLTSILSAGSIKTVGSACGSYDIVAKGDLNNDGNDDIIIGPKVKFTTPGCITNPFAKPIVALYDPLTKNFNSNASIQSVLPEMQWMQFANIGDFNGDGFKDIFAVGTGTDYGQPCGEAPVLMLGSANGLVDASNFLPRFATYSHQATSGDFNGDGKTDFLILNNNWVPTESSDPRISQCSFRKHPGSNKSYIVLSIGNTWKYSEFIVRKNNGDVVIDGNQSFNGVTSGDINGDGITDLVISGSNWGSLAQQTITLLGKGDGTFNYGSSFSVTPFGADTVAVNLSIKQLDESSQSELLINYTRHPGGQALPFQGSIYRIFSFNKQSSTWSDSTDNFITNKSNVTETDLTYCQRLYWVDLNSDSKDDLVCATVNPIASNNIEGLSPRIWLRDGNQLKPTYHRGIDLSRRLGSPTPVKIGSQFKIVGIPGTSIGNILKIDIVD